MAVTFKGGTVTGVTNSLLTKYTLNGFNNPSVSASATQVDAQGILIGGFGLSGTQEISATLKGTNLNVLSTPASLDPAILLGSFSGLGITIQEVSAQVGSDLLLSLAFDPALSTDTFTPLPPGIPLTPPFPSNASTLIQGRIFAGADTLTGSAFSDSLVGYAGSDLITGGDGDDTLLGGGGIDTIRGGGGKDIIHGGADKDVIHGGADNDIINGGKGDDILAGGNGQDRFVFSSGTAFTAADLGIDRIADYKGEDRIILDAVTFTALTGSTLAGQFATAISDADAAIIAATIVYNSNNGKLFYNTNGTADGFGDGAQFATFVGNPTLSANSFAIRPASAPA